MSLNNGSLRSIGAIDYRTPAGKDYFIEDYPDLEQALCQLCADYFSKLEASPEPEPEPKCCRCGALIFPQFAVAGLDEVMCFDCVSKLSKRDVT